ncbi:distal membrane-arm assembly complex protein 2-like [Ylistrum balloti]|uniref:distal membrane-arm assembly complex protein 2-like n=1 Tax=Ylistrum balloti TaxID=509963 RepID=UPI002905D4E0|nr:distal membrane-arm assembly complex protein 2-like [Ylistrum balloti]
MSTTFKKMLYQSTSHRSPASEPSPPNDTGEKTRLDRIVDFWSASLRKPTPETKWTTYQDFTLESIQEMLQKKIWQNKVKKQSFDMQRYESLGPDMSAAQFVLDNGGKIKIDGVKNWIPLSEESGSSLMFLKPDGRLETMKVEGLDLSGVPIVFEAFRNFVNLQNVRYIRIWDNDIFDDFSLTQFALFRDSLEFLDISRCPQLTERGLAWLHHLENLKCLRLDDLKGVEDPEVVIDLIRDMLPNCQVQGIIGTSPVQEDIEPAPPNRDHITT